MNIKKHLALVLINLLLALNLSAQPCSDCAFPTQVITGTIDSTVITGRIDGRLFRDAIQSSCTDPAKACPSIINAGTPNLAEVYEFTNESDTEECIRVEYNPDTCNTSVHATAYLGNFVANPTPTDAGEAICGTEELG